MINREKVIKGLECCIEKLDTVTNKTHGFNCTACPYFKRCDSSGYLVGLPLMKDALVLLKAQEPIEARLNLCDSCAKLYPECDATADAIKFGCGVGNDNVIGCMAYVNRWKAKQPRVMTLEEVEDALDTVVWVDRPDMENTSEAYARISAYSRVNKEIWLRYAFIEKPRTKVEAYGDYGITYRCWTSRPTDEQREAIPWQE